MSNTEQNKLRTILSKYITRETHAGSVNRILELAEQEIEAYAQQKADILGVAMTKNSIDDVLETHAETWIDVNQARKDGDYNSSQAIDEFEASLAEAKAQLKQIMLECVPEELSATTRTVGSLGSYNQCRQEVIDNIKAKFKG